MLKNLSVDFAGQYVQPMHQFHWFSNASPRFYEKKWLQSIEPEHLGLWQKISLYSDLFLFKKFGFNTDGYLLETEGNIPCMLFELEKGKLGGLYKKNGSLVAMVTDEGTLYFADEHKVYNLFNNPRFVMKDVEHLKAAGKLGEALKTFASKRATKNAMGPWIQQEIYRKFGLTGSGVQIALIDSMKQNHAKNVQNIIKDKSFGLAPDANICLREIETEQEASPLPKYLNDLSVEGTLAKDFCDGIKLIQTPLEAFLHVKKPPAIVNISLGLSPAVFAETVLQERIPMLMERIQKERLLHQFKDSDFIKLYNTYTDKNSSSQQLAQATANYVNKILNHSNQIMHTLAKYNGIIDKLAEKGVVVVIAAENRLSTAISNIELTPYSHVNFLGMNDNVILVGASNPMGTPKDLSDDVPAYFTAPGMGHYQTASGYYQNPTIAAPGNQIPLTKKEFLIFNHVTSSDGTSYSAAWVSGLIALMKQANPNLSPKSIKHLLEQSAENPQQAPFELVGAGFSNPVKAVHLAVETLKGC